MKQQESVKTENPKSETPERKPKSVNRNRGKSFAQPGVEKRG